MAVRLIEVRDDRVAKTVHRFEHLVQQPRQGPDHASDVVLVEKHSPQRIELTVRIVARSRRRDGLLE